MRTTGDWTQRSGVGRLNEEQQVALGFVLAYGVYAGLILAGNWMPGPVVALSIGLAAFLLISAPLLWNLHRGKPDRLAAMLDDCPVGLMLIDGDHYIVHINRPLLAVLRQAEAGIREGIPLFSVDALTGTPLDDLPLTDPYRHGQAWQTTLVLGSRHFRLKAERTGERPVGRAGGRRADSSPQILAWTDITEELQHRETEKQNQQEAFRLRRALDNINTNVMVADEEYTIVYMNETMQQMLRQPTLFIHPAI